MPITRVPRSTGPVQLNDTHPAIAVAELMRLLVDEHAAAIGTRPGTITCRSLAYTNHTLLPEALEMLGAADCSARCCRATWRSSSRSTAAFCRQVRIRYPGNEARAAPGVDHRRGGQQGRAHGQPGHRGAATTSTAWRRCTANWCTPDLLPEFAALWPEKFTNVTNGVTPRRWLALANPAAGGRCWRRSSAKAGWRDLGSCAELERATPTTAASWSAGSRQAGRQAPPRELHPPRSSGLLVDPASLFDVQVKRIHEYKRQHLNALQVVARYLRIKNGRHAGHGAAHGDLRRQGRAGLRAWPS
jgi:starch phosphorylase